MRKLVLEIVAWWAHFRCRKKKKNRVPVRSMSCQLGNRAP
jgi:hypothetical protein